MEFSVNKVALVRELSLSQGVVEKRTTIPILSNVLIEAKEGCIQLTATDLELGIRCACPAKVVKQGAGTLPLRRVLDYVRLLPDVEVAFKFLENHWASLSCGRSRTRIAGMSRESFPELPQVPDVVTEAPAGVLSSLIAKTIFAISAEESRFTLNGALLLLRSAGVVMVATDGHRLAYVEAALEIPGLVTPHRVLLPKKAMIELLKLAQEVDAATPVRFASDENHLFFQVAERLLISRKLVGTFPDYERVLPKECRNSVTVNREEVRLVIERVSQFADERSHAIRVQVVPGGVTFHSSVSETGESEEMVPAEYEGGELDIGFNAQYLLEFLRATSEERVLISFRDSHSAAEMRPADSEEGQRYRYVLMPMRI